MRCRHAVPPNALSVIGSGTSQSESLHHEINTWFRNQPELHRSTLQFQLDINCFAKLITHNAALYRPSLRQLDQRTLLCALAPRLDVPLGVWSAWAGLLADGKAARQHKATLPLQAERLWTTAQVRKRKVARRTLTKKPASNVVLLNPVRKPVKRTVFTRLRACDRAS